MKTIIFSIAILFVTLNAFAQDLSLTFNGSGLATTVDNITAYNQSSGQEVSIAGNTLQLKSVISSIANLTENRHFRVWPNPFNESINFEFLLKKPENTIITISNSLGQQIASSVQYLKAGKNQFIFNSKDKGLYHIQVITAVEKMHLSVLCDGGSSAPAEIRFIGSNDITDVIEGREKSTKEDIYLAYTPGDRIFFKVTSGNYISAISDIPTMNKTYNVSFVYCTDADNNHYAAVQIGTQTWMAENLKTTKFNDNTTIPLVADETAWFNATTPAFCYYQNNQLSYKNKYGALYNWYSIDTIINGNKNICPVGWHVPSDVDWAIMENYLIANGFNYDGTIDDDGDRNTNNKIAKSLATSTGWPNIYDITGTVGKTDFPEKRNSTGFTALPGGSRIGRYFFSIGEVGYWWTTTSFDTYKAWFRYFETGSTSIYRYNDKSKNTGLSVRCIKN